MRCPSVVVEQADRLSARGRGCAAHVLTASCTVRRHRRGDEAPYPLPHYSAARPERAASALDRPRGALLVERTALLLLVAEMTRTAERVWAIADCHRARATALKSETGCGFPDASLLPQVRIARGEPQAGLVATAVRAAHRVGAVPACSREAASSARRRTAAAARARRGQRAPSSRASRGSPPRSPPTRGRRRRCARTARGAPSPSPRGRARRRRPWRGSRSPRPRWRRSSRRRGGSPAAEVAAACAPSGRRRSPSPPRGPPRA